MSHSRIRSVISAALVSFVGACGDDSSCGIGGAPVDGITASNVDVQFVFTAFTAGPNHDCPVPDAPAGVESLTIQSMQENGTGLFTACVPRPDLFTAEQAIGTTMTAAFSLVDLSGIATNGCKYTIDRSIPPTGMANADGICNAGTNKAGFALNLDGAVSIKQITPQPATCTAPSSTTFAVTLKGRTAVTAQ